MSQKYKVIKNNGYSISCRIQEGDTGEYIKNVTVSEATFIFLKMLTGNRKGITLDFYDWQVAKIIESELNME